MSTKLLGNDLCFTRDSMALCCVAHGIWVLEITLWSMVRKLTLLGSQSDCWSYWLYCTIWWLHQVSNYDDWSSFVFNSQFVVSYFNVQDWEEDLIE